MKMHKLFAGAAVVTVLAGSLVLTACGGGDGEGASEGSSTGASSGSKPKTTNEKFVAGFCTAEADFNGSVADADRRYQASISKLDASKYGVEEIKTLAIDKLKATQEAAKAYEKEIRSLKAPDIEDGGKFQKALVKLAAETSKVADQLVSETQQIKATSVASFNRELEAVDQRVGDSDDLTKAQDELDQFDTTELDRLYDSRPECTGLE
jgi:hypothetical protein